MFEKFSKGGDRIHSERVTNLNELDHIDPTLPTLDLRYKCLRVTKTFGQCKLSDTCPFPQVAEQCQ